MSSARSPRALALDHEQRLMQEGGLTREISEQQRLFRQRYPSLAANQLRLVRAAASLFDATSWFLSFEELRGPRLFRMGQFERDTGRLLLRRSTYRLLDRAYAGRIRRYHLLSRVRLQHKLSTVFHELIHSLGPGERVQFLLASAAASREDREGERPFLEGIVEFGSKHHFAAFKEASGLGNVPAAPGLSWPALNDYAFDAMWIARRFRRGARKSGATVDNLLAKVIGDYPSRASLSKHLGE